MHNSARCMIGSLTSICRTRGSGLGDVLLMWVEDPLKPRDEHGRLRVNPILLLLAIVFALVFGIFLVFSVVQS